MGLEVPRAIGRHGSGAVVIGVDVAARVFGGGFPTGDLQDVAVRSVDETENRPVSSVSVEGANDANIAAARLCA